MWGGVGGGGVWPRARGGRSCWRPGSSSGRWRGCWRCWSAPRGCWVPSPGAGTRRSRRRRRRRWRCSSCDSWAGCRWRLRPRSAEEHDRRDRHNEEGFGLGFSLLHEKNLKTRIQGPMRIEYDCYRCLPSHHSAIRGWDEPAVEGNETTA